MAPRDTGTGFVLEEMVAPALARGGYTVEKQVYIGLRPGGGRHVVDAVATDAQGARRLVSVKWQQVSGSAEQKVPFEVICLAEAMMAEDKEYVGAYLVLGGEGWRLRDFYIQGGLARHLTYADLVSIVSLEAFVARANRGAL
jgi:hypothetical protein